MTKEQSLEIRQKMADWAAKFDWNKITTTKSEYIEINHSTAFGYTIEVCRGKFHIRESNLCIRPLFTVANGVGSASTEYGFEYETERLVRNWQYVKSKIILFFENEEKLSEKIAHFEA